MGIISSKAHTVIGLVMGVALVFASTLFGFADVEAAAMVSLIVGIFIVANELITTSPFSLIKLIPMKVHIAVDVLTGVFLVASPWLFGFFDSNEPMQWVPHVVAGVITAGYALLTTTDDARKSVAA